MLLSDFLDRFPADREAQDDGVLVHCPAHSDSQASLRVAVSASTGKVLLKCRAGCGNADVMKALGLSLRDLATMDPTGVHMARATSTDAPAGEEAVAALAGHLYRWSEGLSAEAQRYAEDRFGLAPEGTIRLGLGSTTELGGGERLVVPFRDPQGVPRGFQARALDPSVAVRWIGPESPEGASWSKIGWLPGGSGWDEVVITEGPGDGLTAAALGYDAILVRGAGLVNNPAVVDEIAAWLGDRVAVIAGDGDPSGEAFSSTLSQGLVGRGRRAKILPVPTGEDLSSWRAQDPTRFSTEVVRAIVSAQEVSSTTAALRSRDTRRYPLSDLGNARYLRDFITARGSGVKFSPEAGFFLLDEGVWRADRLDRVRAFAQETADRIGEIARDLEENAGTDTTAQAVAKAWKTWAKYAQSMNGLNAALRELQALPEVSVDFNDFDRHAHYLACVNGVIDLRSGELLPHDPGLLLTRRVEHRYDPAARAPRWEAFLEEVFPNHPDLPAYMKRLVGYGVTGSTAEQCFAVLWGTGANGKSVFTDTLTEIFRELTVTTPFSTFEDRASGGIPNDIAALKGSRLVMAAEGEQGRPMAESVLKRVTGRDLISARFMRKEFFEFRPTFLLILATNFKPNFKGQDEGLWRRVKLIPWERFFAPQERDHRLGERLLAEAPGILTWAVQGAVEWYRRGGLGDPEAITGATKEYRQTSDALAGFFPGTFVADGGRTRTDGKTLFDAYLSWSDEENLPQREIWTRKAFYAALEERGCVKRSTKTGVAFEGIRRARQSDAVKDHDEPEHDPEEPEVRDAVVPLAEPPASPTTVVGPSLAGLFG